MSLATRPALVIASECGSSCLYYDQRPEIKGKGSGITLLHLSSRLLLLGLPGPYRNYAIDATKLCS